MQNPIPPIEKLALNAPPVVFQQGDTSDSPEALELKNAANKVQSRWIEAKADFAAARARMALDPSEKVEEVCRRWAEELKLVTSKWEQAAMAYRSV
jgi:hypothetical protein